MESKIPAELKIICFIDSILSILAIWFGLDIFRAGLQLYGSILGRTIITAAVIIFLVSLASIFISLNIWKMKKWARKAEFVISPIWILVAIRVISLYKTAFLEVFVVSALIIAVNLYKINYFLNNK